MMLFIYEDGEIATSEIITEKDRTAVNAGVLSIVKGFQCARGVIYKEYINDEFALIHKLVRHNSERFKPTPTKEK